MMEQHLSIIKEAISRSREGKEAVLILIKQAIPCIMHLENRGGEKIITIILSIGAGRYQLGRGSSNLEGFAKQISITRALTVLCLIS
jgi:hypothetical protein